MPGTIPVSGNLSLEDLAATLTSHEQLAFEQVTALSIDPTRVRNLVTTVAQPQQLGPLALSPSGQPAHGTRLLSTIAYILGTKASVDLLRLPLPEVEREIDADPRGPIRRVNLPARDDRHAPVDRHPTPEDDEADPSPS